jgi:hypothetical protein
MNLLKALNLKPGFIYEILCGTYSPNGVPNLAPIGLRLDNELVLAPYVTTQTYKNLETTRCCSINFSEEAWIFAWACFEKERLQPYLSAGKKSQCPVLRGALAYVECKIEQIMTTTDKTRPLVICRPVHVELQEKFMPFTRAFSLLVEMLIHSTRIAHFEDLGDLRKVQELKQDILKYSRIIQRVANTEFPAIVDYILKQVGLEHASDG